MFNTILLDSSKCCYMLSQSTGQFQSINYDSNFECSWLIAVEENHNIWLTFTEFQLERYYYHIQVIICMHTFYFAVLLMCIANRHIKVYDGPYSTSPLILDRSGYQVPPSLRSSTNKLFVKLVSKQQEYNRQSYGKQFKAQYAAVSQYFEIILVCLLKSSKHEMITNFASFNAGRGV